MDQSIWDGYHGSPRNGARHREGRGPRVVDGNVWHWKHRGIVFGFDSFIASALVRGYYSKARHNEKHPDQYWSRRELVLHVSSSKLKVLQRDNKA